MPTLAKFSAVLLLVATAGCGVLPESRAPLPSTPAEPPKSVAPAIKPAPKIALALGGGAARGYAHVGVIKALESQGIKADMVAGTSAGSVVAALYAAGYGGFDLQKIALQMEAATISDWSLPDRGVIKGEQLQNYINKAVKNRPIEKLKKTLGVVATNLQSGEQVVFRQGNTGMAVRASSSVPGVFQPVLISGNEYVDGGLTSPVPVVAAKELGADIVIAVDISNKPKHGKVKDTIDVLLQTFSIMGQSIGNLELAGADIVIRPNTGLIGATDFNDKHLAILEGERAALEAVPLIRTKIREFMEKGGTVAVQTAHAAQAAVKTQADVAKLAPAPVPVIEKSVPVIEKPAPAPVPIIEKLAPVPIIEKRAPAPVPIPIKESVPVKESVPTYAYPADRVRVETEADVTRSVLAMVSVPTSSHPAAETMYRQGLKQEKEGSLAAAFKSFHEAASSGSGLAMKKLGDIYNVGNNFVRRDYATSIKWYSKAGEHGVSIPRELLKR